MQIVNIVASGDLNQRIDYSELTPLHEKLLNNPEKYHGCYIRLSACKATLYKTGKFIFTGLKSPESVQETWDEFYNTLTSVISITSPTPPKVNNIVSVHVLNHPVNLTKLCLTLSFDNVEYEPEQFPGLILRKNGLVPLIFASGKMIITGSTDPERSNRTFEEIQSIINNL